MSITKKSVLPFSAKVTFGLEYGYTQEVINKEDVIKQIQNIQKKLIAQKNIYLSVAISETIIVMSGQVEPHLIFSFINYPKFRLKHTILRAEIETLTKQLMILFEQNRVVIEYLDETIMLEIDEKIDPRVKNNSFKD